MAHALEISQSITVHPVLPHEVCAHKIVLVLGGGQRPSTDVVSVPEVALVAA